MRYRALDANYDPMWGQGQNNFLVDKAAVVQAIQTVIRLFQGEWFLNLNDGTPMFQEILGQRTAQADLDRILRTRISGTQGVQSIQNFSSTFDWNSRTYGFACTVNTIYGAISVTNIPTPQGVPS
jgi:hypothetical protein